MAEADSNGSPVLPTLERRVFILEGLEALRRRRGDATFVHGRILEPGDRDFPDAWEPTTEGAARLTRRVLRHAGMADHEVEMVGFLHGRDRALDVPGVVSTSAWHDGTAAWFAGIDPETRVCFFGIDLDGLEDAASVVGTMCHEVAHAYRQAHGIAIEERDLDEEMTDLTTVFLGFGLLTANSAYVYRSESLEGRSLGGMQWRHSQRGYLTVAEMAYALAYQVGVRERHGKRGEAAWIAARLEPTQRECFEAALIDRGERRRWLPPWAPFALIAIAPLLLFAGWLVVELSSVPRRCTSPRDCGTSDEFDRCLEGRCERVCEDTNDCSDDRRCVRHLCE